MSGKRLEVLDILGRASDYLGKAGVPGPRLDAEVLLAHVLGLPRISLYTGFDRPLTEEELASYRALLRRRAERIPVAYLTGEKEFHSLCFRVTRDVLIPRPETEHLVDRAVQLGGERNDLGLLDIGTGSGCIVVSIAFEIPGARFVATDLASGALDVAGENARRHGVIDRGEFRVGSFYDPVREGEAFDLIVVNPPYVSRDEEVDPECRAEPDAALFAEDVPKVYRTLLEGAPPRLAPGGRILLELPGTRVERVLAEVPESLEVEEIVRDYGGLPRVLVCRAAGSGQSAVT